jgi:uncharacterized repeat protein (TIGR02543 family)
VVLVLGLLALTGCPFTRTHTLTTSANPAGAGSVSPSGGDYDDGVTVTLTATAHSGYAFDYWSGSASGTSPTTTIVMDADKNVTAHFTPVAQSYNLSINVSPTDGGSVSPSGGTYDDGTSVTLTATAASGYAFDYWSGGASGTISTTTIVMNADKTVTANFVATGPVVLFSDDFSNPSSGWVTYDGPDGRVRYYNGALYIKDYSAYSLSMYGEAQRYFTDFILEVETWLVGGTDDNWQTVGCRLDSSANGYGLGISADGYYMISLQSNDNVSNLTGPTYSSYINQGVGAVNTIHIECIGNSLSLSVNGHLLATVTDNTISGGDICLSADALAGTYTEVAFDNLVVTTP